MSNVVAFINDKGGVGKTTSVVECAYHACADSNKKCLVIDLDPQANATRMLTSRKHEYSIFDCIVGNRNLFDTMIPALDNWERTLCVPSDRRLGGIEQHLITKLNKETILKKLIAPVRDYFDLILIDLAPGVSSLTINALVAADAYIIPTDTSEYSLSGIEIIKLLADEIIDTGNNEKLNFMGILLTSFQKGGSIAVSEFVKTLNEKYPNKILSQRVPDSVKVLDSQRKNSPVGAIDSDCTVSIAYKELTNLLLSNNILLNNKAEKSQQFDAEV